MEAHLKDIGSTDKLVASECLGHQLMKCSKVSGNKTKQRICAYSDRVMVKTCLVIRQTTGWTKMTRNRKINRMVKALKCGVMEAITMVTLRKA